MVSKEHNIIQQPIGLYIRQLRRERSLTQSELGETHFSKSYVSAVERGTILPSYEALRFFAEQLDQPVDAFKLMTQQNEQSKHVLALPIAESPQTSDPHQEHKEIIELLDVALDGTEFYYAPSLEMLPIPSDEILTKLPAPTQARYFFLQGLAAFERKNYSSAIAVFERALVAAPLKHQPVILDALGKTYFQLQMYHVSLSYYKRALEILQEQSHAAALLLSIELHCGDIYCALGLHTAAYTRYERARQYLRSTDNIQMAGHLYGRLGYCTYASFYLKGPTIDNYAEEPGGETYEQKFQKAISFLLQSRILYQVGREQAEENRVRLLYAMIALDHCLFRKQKALNASKQSKKQPVIYVSAQLDDADDQCRQVLLNQQDNYAHAGIPEANTLVTIYTALAYHIRISTLRASIARLTGFIDTAARERSFAASLYQMVLESLNTFEFSWRIVNNVLSLAMADSPSQAPPLPRMPKLTPLELQEYWQPRLLAEVFFAGGEVAEEIGRAATSEEYAHDCYLRVNEYLHVALQMYQQTLPDIEYDFTYLTRSYMRCVMLLEERIEAFPLLEKETTQTLICFLKEGFVLAHHQQLAHKSCIG